MKIAASKLSFIKPSGPLKVWQIIEKVIKNGQLLKFTIQELPEDRYDDAIEHMNTYFLADEATCKYLKVKNDPISVKEFNVIWRNILKQGISIGAFVDNPDGKKPIIAGLNMLSVNFKNHEIKIDDYNLTSEKIKTICKMMIDLNKEAKICERYGVDKYLYAFGLSVAPAYRGYGLGAHILQVRDKIGCGYNIPVTSTSFSSSVSSKSAERAGFQELLTKNYADIVHENGKQCFPGIEHKMIKLMAKKLL